MKSRGAWWKNVLYKIPLDETAAIRKLNTRPARRARDSSNTDTA